MVYKRSTDGGQTWSALAVLYGNSTAGQPNVWIGNAAPLQDRDSGRIVVPFCRNNLQVLLTHSDDDGVTWTAPFNLTGVTMPDWFVAPSTAFAVLRVLRVLAGRGSVSALPVACSCSLGAISFPRITRSPKTMMARYADRMAFHSFTESSFVSGSLCRASAPVRLRCVQFSSGHVMLSDDRGATWYIGGNWTFGKQLPNECQGVELAPNQVFINSRSISEIRIGAISNDGGCVACCCCRAVVRGSSCLKLRACRLTWPQVFKINDLVQPNTGCEGSTVRHPKTGWLFYSGLNEHNLIALRWNMTVYISKVGKRRREGRGRIRSLMLLLAWLHWQDNGTSWQLWKVVFSGSAAYSSLTIRPDMSVGLLYEWETAVSASASMSASS